MIPISTDYRMRIRPWVNYALIAINVLVFFAKFHGGNMLVRHLLLQPTSPQLYQFFTSMFMHGSWEHLGGNMVFLWVFGSALNDRLGHLGYLLFYLAGGVFAALGYLLVSGGAPVLGASGAICAVTGAYMVLFPRVNITMLFWFIIITTFEVSSLFFLAIQFVWNLWMSAQVAVAPNVSTGVAYVAHSAGYIYGIAIAAALLMSRMLPRDAFDLPNLIQNWRRRQKYKRMVSGGYEPFAPQADGVTKRKVQAKVRMKPRHDTPSATAIAHRKALSDAIHRNDLDEAANQYRHLVAEDPELVLPRQQQLDIANHLMSAQAYDQAAEAYERFLATYPHYRFIADIHLMLGLLYGRYLHRDDRAEQMLDLAQAGLTDATKRQLVHAELAELRKRSAPESS
jgi:membrane associated rhomboid family serine protease